MPGHSRHKCGGVRRGRRAWLRCPWAVVVPGRGIHSDLAPLVSRAPKGPEGLAVVPVGGGRARAGLEIDHSEPSGSRVAISRAGRRPPAHTAAGPHSRGLRPPEHPWRTQTKTSGTGRRHDPRFGRQGTQS